MDAKKKLPVLIGINAFHADSAAALVVGDQVIAAAEEERFRRIKHWAGFPAQAIAWCLQEAGLSLADVDVVAVNTDPAASRRDRWRHVLAHWPSPGMLLDRLRARRARLSIREHLRLAFPDQLFRGEVMPIEHHLAHLASAYYDSGWQDSAVLSVDGMGDFASASYGVGTSDGIRVLGRVPFPHSLGVFYQALTQYLGFPHYGDEYKVMGLAPYGAPTVTQALSEVLHVEAGGDYRLNLDFFRHHRERIAFDWTGGVPEFVDLFTPRLESLLGPRRRADEPLTQRHRDIAHSAQIVYEEAFFALLRKVHRETGATAVCLSGGCAQNSVANGKVGLHTPFERVHVAPAGYDAGGATGAAMIAAARRGLRVRSHGAYLGPCARQSEIDALLAAALQAINDAGCSVQDFSGRESGLFERVCAVIESGGVVGWFQGAMEWGPRALGNRSILADPRRSDVKEILNAKIKRRESFRPFAPSVLREAVGDWFEQDGEVPYMAQVFQIRAERRAQIPAVTHVDGSGRLQTVSQRDNARYHALISCFFQRTGVPMLLNTSFNENEPIVCRPQEALDCFLRTRMDLLVLGDTVISREVRAA